MATKADCISFLDAGRYTVEGGGLERAVCQRPVDRSAIIEMESLRLSRRRRAESPVDVMY